MHEEVQQRVGSIIGLRPEYRERYIILHKHTFSEVLERLHRSNVRNYSIYLLDDLLFSYLEYVGGDYEADMNAIGDPATKEWWKLTDPMQEPLPSRKPGEWWATLDDLGHISGSIEGDVLRRAFTRFLPRGEQISVPSLPAQSGVRNVSIYSNNDRLFVYLESERDARTGSVERLLEAVRAGDEPGASTGLAWREMTEVFHTH